MMLLSSADFAAFIQTGAKMGVFSPHVEARAGMWYNEAKEEGRIKAIVVTGCLAERYRTEIRREIPEVDAVIGIGANGEIVELV